MKKQLSPAVVVIVIIVILVILAGVWYMTYGKKPAKKGWQGPVPKAMPPGAGPPPGVGGAAGPVPPPAPAPPAPTAPGG